MSKREKVEEIEFRLAHANGLLEEVWYTMKNVARLLSPEEGAPQALSHLAIEKAGDCIIEAFKHICKNKLFTFAALDDAAWYISWAVAINPEFTEKEKEKLEEARKIIIESRDTLMSLC